MSNMRRNRIVAVGACPKGSTLEPLCADVLDIVEAFLVPRGDGHEGWKCAALRLRAEEQLIMFSLVFSWFRTHARVVQRSLISERLRIRYGWKTDHARDKDDATGDLLNWAYPGQAGGRRLIGDRETHGRMDLHMAMIMAERRCGGMTVRGGRCKVSRASIRANRKCRNWCQTAEDHRAYVARNLEDNINELLLIRCGLCAIHASQAEVAIARAREGR